MSNHLFFQPLIRQTFVVMNVGIVCLIAVPALAADFGAKISGNWNSSTTWTPNGVPGLNDVAGIGSTYPIGAAATATVLLTQNQQANTVYLGYGPGTSGTLNLGNFNLTADYLVLGFDGGTGSISRWNGYFDVASLQPTASTLAMSTTDRTKFLNLRGGSSVTTAATGNITHTVVVDTGSTLTLGADLYLSIPMDTTTVNVRGANSTLDAQGYRLTATEMYLGWYGDGNARLLNKGQLVLDAMTVANQNFYLEPIDQVGGFHLFNGYTHFAPGTSVRGLGLNNGSTATTTEVGNITGSIGVQSGSTLTLGADFIGDGSIDLRDNSTLDAQGHNITAGSLFLGWFGGNNARLLNKGNLALNGSLCVANHNFDLDAGDQVAGLALSDGTGSTSATGNITYAVDVTSGSTLTLGADLSVSGIVQVYGDNSTLDAQGHKITAETLQIGAGNNVRLLNKGDLTITSTLVVFIPAFNLTDTDRVTNYLLFGGSSNLGPNAVVQNIVLGNTSAATTSVTGNLTGSVEVTGGSTLTLGADLSVPGSVKVSGNNSTFDAQFHRITADTLELGCLGEPNVQFRNKGVLEVTNLMLGAQNMELSASDRVVNLRVDIAVGGIGSTLSTASTANVTGSVLVGYNSTLTLGADLTVSGPVMVSESNSTINAQGHKITASDLALTGANFRLLNDGAITVSGSLSLLGDNQVELNDGNDTAHRLYLDFGSSLRIKSAATGFTITGTTTDSLLLGDANTLTLELDGSQPGWVFRWANPAGGNHIADLNALIADDFIRLSVTNGGEFNIVSQDGYTYIGLPVPEPSSFALFLLGLPLLAYRKSLCKKERRG